MTIAPEAPTAADAAAPVEPPLVHQAIALAMRDTIPVGKDQRNDHQRYNFRGIDDLMSAVAGPLRAHGVFIVPEVVDRAAEQRGKMINVVLTMRYRIYGPAGDWIEAVVPGEASDTADKATNKAMSAALKYLLLQVLMVPVDARSIDDGDRHHPANPDPEQERQQPQGPQRDYIAEAQHADNPHQFAKIRAAAAENGAPDDYLARLDAVARQKANTVANNPHRYRDGEQQPQTAAEGRDYLAEARSAATAAEVVKVYREAEADGARRAYLDQLAAVGREKRAAERAAAPEDVTDAGENGWAAEQADDGRRAAVEAMYAAAYTAGLSLAEADDAFRAANGCMPADATLDQLTAQTADLRSAVQGEQ